jgi:hypothetical protein
MRGQPRTIGSAVKEQESKLKPLPNVILYRMGCMYCGHQEIFVARNGSESMSDKNILSWLQGLNKEIFFCEYCKFNQVHQFNGYYGVDKL